MEYGNSLHSLIPLAEFKNILEIDDRENALCRFVLIASTYTIEQYCKRRLLRKKRLEFFPFYGDYVFPLGEYPVREIMAVQHIHKQKETTIVDPELCRMAPEIGTVEDAPFCLSVSPAVRLVRGLSGLRVLYRAGYAAGRVPADLGSACLELAAWNLNRYRGRRIGMMGNGKGGEQLETSMPENVKMLLEPYRRKTI
jgi:uncharacterized phiE125 gp8 family phage protein